jgi:flagellar M-ring protein FliF
VGLVRGLPRPARILASTTLVVAIGAGIWLSLRSAYEPYAMLFSQMEREDAGAVVAKLKEMRVPYRVTAEGTAIEVPEPRVHEVRLELASAGLPRGGGVGFEGFDNMRLGATEFEQRVLYRRAMEGELGRTIGGIAAVKSARVHLVMPERSVFAARREPASASVIVKLRAGRTLGSSEVGGIVHLVAAAVPGLTSDRVTLVTSEGIALHRSRGGNAEGSGSGVDLGDPESHPARALETSLEERARAQLERVLGPGHVDVRVSAEMDLSRVERTEDHYDPASTVLRSEEATREHAAGGTEDTVAGVPGAESNLPGAKPEGAAGAAGTGAVLRETHTRNWEVNHVQEKRVSTSGTIRRLTVAVVVDGVPGPEGKTVPVKAEDLDKLGKLVRSAVGADDKRGDVVTVEQVRFQEPEAQPVAVAPVSIVSRLPAPVRKWGPIGVGAALVLFFAFAVLVRRARRRAEPLETIALPAPGPEPELLPQGPSPAQMRDEAVRQAQLDPATAALVVKYWLGSGAEQETTKQREAA